VDSTCRSQHIPSLGHCADRSHRTHPGTQHGVQIVFINPADRHNGEGTCAHGLAEEVGSPGFHWGTPVSPTEVFSCRTEDRAEAEVVQRQGLGSFDLLEAVGGPADQDIGPQQLPCLLGSSVFLAEVDAHSWKLSGEVDPIIEDEVRSSGGCDREQLFDQLAKLLVVRRLVSELEYEDPRPEQCGGDLRVCSVRGAGVDDPVEPSKLGAKKRGVQRERPFLRKAPRISERLIWCSSNLRLRVLRLIPSRRAALS